MLLRRINYATNRCRSYHSRIGNKGPTTSCLAITDIVPMSVPHAAESNYHTAVKSWAELGSRSPKRNRGNDKQVQSQRQKCYRDRKAMGRWGQVYVYSHRAISFTSTCLHKDTNQGTTTYLPHEPQKRHPDPIDLNSYKLMTFDQPLAVRE